ncbi:MAG: hypothetical protein RL299_2067 [Pseudomonadota bacterium]|jgi:uncharacterized protein (DUF2147 family)
MTKFRGAAGFAALVFAVTLGLTPSETYGSGTAQPAPVYGTWINPKRTVTVVTSACGQLLCGTIVSATPEVQAIAKKAGAPPLVGSKLLRDYRQTGKEKWQGKVFVPDRNASYYSTIKQLNANQLKISGCILGGLLCKSQIWTRV